MTLSNHFWRLLTIQAVLSLVVALSVAGLAAAGQTGAVLWLAAVAGVAASAAVTWFSLRQVFGPLEELSGSARKLSASNGDGLAGDDELGELAAVLGRMERDLSQRVGRCRSTASACKPSSAA